MHGFNAATTKYTVVYFELILNEYVTFILNAHNMMHVPNKSMNINIGMHAPMMAMYKCYLTVD
jgi:hypothetical protein